MCVLHPSTYWKCVYEYYSRTIYILHFKLLSIVLIKLMKLCLLFVILIFLLYHGTGVPMFIIIYCLYTILFKLPRQRPHL